MTRRTKLIIFSSHKSWLSIVLLMLLLIDGVIVGQSQNRQNNSRSRRGPSLTELISQQLMVTGDKDENGSISQIEMADASRAWFDRLNPDKARRISREEFLRRFERLLPSNNDTSRRSSSRGRQPGRNLGVFLAIDSNGDSFLNPKEWTETFENWFLQWSEGGPPELNLEQIIKGLESEMPRTNLTGAYGQNAQERIAGLPTPPPSPILSSEAALKTIDIDSGFHLELMASEPTIQDPISLSFDADGRLYVIEMRNYMLDMNRSGERDPIARISRLEDRNGDGHYDHSTVFLDGLVNPRSISNYRGGIFYVADGKLFFARDNTADGHADENLLVDPDYGGGNIEHAPNGMMPAMDNWIYNARSQRQYRWIHNTLVVRATENRGQWGITQDNYGRLFFNVNNSQLLGDYTPPNYLSRNPNYQATAGLNLFVSTDQRVFSRRMNTGINRGYSKDVLDASGRAYVFASSCGPVIYRGDNFPSEFVGNAFVCDPALNLIKRNIVFDQNLSFSSRFAYPDREFIASSDERFRPVNAFNGPDGTLWIVDMYRGIAQYGMFMTEYLKKETLERELQKGIHLGRIYRVVSNAKPPSPVLRLSGEDSPALVSHLGHPNGWVRDTAQRLLVERQDRSAALDLLEVIRTSSDPLQRIHALWTIEGIFTGLPEGQSGDAASNSIRLVSLKLGDGLPPDPTLPLNLFEGCLAAIADANPKVRVAAIRVCESLSRNTIDRQQALQKSLDDNSSEDTPDEVLFQAALSAGSLPMPTGIPVLAKIARMAIQHLIVREAVISGLHNWELQFLQYLLTDPEWRESLPGRSAMFQALASAIVKEAVPTKVELLLTLIAEQDAAESQWRRRGLLEGLASNARGRITKPIRFKAAPKALRHLESKVQGMNRTLLEQSLALFTWGDRIEDTPSPNEANLSRTPATKEEAEVLANGKVLYQQVCAGCHGLNGEGLKPLAPPLVESEWLSDRSDRLIRIVLQGIAGPVHVNGTRYQAPNILPEMPALSVLDDFQIFAVSRYIQSEWGQVTDEISSELVSEIRTSTSSRNLPWTEAELLRLE